MIYDRIIRRDPVDKGWSGDAKYHIFTDNGRDYLLRISPLERLEERRNQFEHMKRSAALGVPLCDPVEFGVCDEGVYQILRWIDGVDAEALIPTLPVDKQYAYGLDAGRILAKIHTLPPAPDTPEWEAFFNKKIDRKLAAYAACPLKYDKDAVFLNHLAGNRHLLRNRPQTYQHGDFHIGNMMVEKGVLTIIDFDRDDTGDPWEEFKSVPWCVDASPAFARGYVDGYFAGGVPTEFWALLRFYLASLIPGNLPWAMGFGEKQVTVMRRQAAQIMDWYADFTRLIPRWYRE